MTQFFSKLSQNYVELLNDNEYYDVTIEVDNVKIPSHKNILCCRSPYLRRVFSSNKNQSNIKLPNISFEIFKIVLRGSRDGFTPKKFHELCDDKPNTITIIKIKGTEEILGGYNPLKWESHGGWIKTMDSFIFSFDSKNIKNAIISNIQKTHEALFCGCKNGPDLADIIITSSDEFMDYDRKYYEMRHYEKRIRDMNGDFPMEDYENI
ncbi:uncharacterized protein OCT59_023476 [Rhizophagus irregularis]|nr:hypothetical protein OCT59_023476 [Rhizophagus irregularis]